MITRKDLTTKVCTKWFFLCSHVSLGFFSDVVVLNFLSSEIFSLLSKKLFSSVSCSFSCVISLWECSSASSTFIYEFEYLNWDWDCNKEVDGDENVIGKKEKSFFFCYCVVIVLGHKRECRMHFAVLAEIIGLSVLNFHHLIVLLLSFLFKLFPMLVKVFRYLQF